MSALDDAGDVVEFRRREPYLIAFLDASKVGINGVPEIKRAREFVDMLDLVRPFGERLSQIN